MVNYGIGIQVNFTKLVFFFESTKIVCSKFLRNCITFLTKGLNILLIRKEFVSLYDEKQILRL